MIALRGQPSREFFDAIADSEEEAEEAEFLFEKQKLHDEVMEKFESERRR